jgi:hypothetical protein
MFVFLRYCIAITKMYNENDIEIICHYYLNYEYYLSAIHI